jgi:hypothetical protein
MDPIIWLDLILVLVVLYILDRNLYHYVDLHLQNLGITLSLQFLKRLLGIRLWLDRQAMVHRGPVGKLWNEYCLWRIRNNPAYRELFQDLPKVQDE